MQLDITFTEIHFQTVTVAASVKIRPFKANAEFRLDDCILLLVITYTISISIGH